MRKLPVAMVISMIGHGAALGWVVHDGDVLAVPRPAAPPQPAAPPVDSTVPEPVSVVLLDLERAPAPDVRSPDRATTRPSNASGRLTRDAPASSLDAERDLGAAERPAIATGRPGAEQPATPGRSRWMTMRGHEQPSLELSPEHVADFLARSKPVPPPPDIPWERLTSEIADLRTQLRRAGARGNQGQIDALRAEIDARTRELAAEELKPAGRGTYLADKETFSARVSADGSVELKDKPERLGWDDRLMLRHGIDPYAHDKLALLDRTRDQRVAVGERHRRAQLGRATELMRNNIDRLWAKTSDLAARKTGLFELWDDCAETGSEDMIAAAAAARLFVIGVIRARLRDGDAYTSAELAELNAHRRSKAVFAPYE